MELFTPFEQQVHKEQREDRRKAALLQAAAVLYHNSSLDALQAVEVARELLAEIEKGEGDVENTNG